MNAITLKEALSNAGAYDGWLYMPKGPWSLDTECVFVSADIDAEPNSTNHLPPYVTAGNWQPILDSEGIEDIVLNAKYQIEDPTLDELFKAFIFYIDNDAFI